MTSRICATSTMASSAAEAKAETLVLGTANFRTKTLDFRGFDSNIISILRGGILMFMGDIPESLSQAILMGILF